MKRLDVTLEEVIAGMHAPMRPILNLGRPGEGAPDEEWPAYYTWIPILAGLWSKERYGIWSHCMTGTEWVKDELYVFPVEREIEYDAENILACIRGGSWRVLHPQQDWRWSGIWGGGWRVLPDPHAGASLVAKHDWCWSADREHPLRVAARTMWEREGDKVGITKELQKYASAVVNARAALEGL